MLGEKAILPQVLIVDDDARLRELLVSYLEQNGFRTVDAADAVAARRSAAETALDIAIIDMMMPGEDGISLASFLHKRYNLPLIMLTAVETLPERYQAFEGGVDDYLTKPFEPKELLYRLRAILRRSGKKTKGKLRFGDYVYRLGEGQLRKDDKPLTLTTAERSLLAALASGFGKLQSRLHLAQALGRQVAPRSIDVHIKRLRDKLENTPHLRTVRSKGYILDAVLEDDENR